MARFDYVHYNTNISSFIFVSILKLSKKASYVCQNLSMVQRVLSFENKLFKNGVNLIK